MIRPIHPFPARMAPELAISEITGLKPNSIVLDPMAGSGTVVRHASELGMRAIGFDSDPLAVLMTRVWTTPIDIELTRETLKRVLSFASDIKPKDADLPWIDEDEETAKFIRYWFGLKQRNALRKIAHGLVTCQELIRKPEKRAALDVLKIALSRIIITKDQGASLARDISHSRPHKVVETSEYDVIAGFQQSALYVSKLLSAFPPPVKASIELGDARSLRVRANSIDAVVTSPPYLNAIDYMRGHRLALVWLGYRFSELRAIRSDSIGAERAPKERKGLLIKDITNAMADVAKMGTRHRSMIDRYAHDVSRMMAEIARVLKPGGKAVLVVGNSCLKGVFVRNSDGIICAAEKVGLLVSKIAERSLPERSRYLPLTSGPLSLRMRTESILTFQKPG
jgi:adenine-specific DNA methylase